MNTLKMKEYRKYLKNHNHEELSEDLVELFKKYKEVKEYFTLKIKPQGPQILFDQTLEKIKKDFEKTPTGRVSFHLPKLRALIKNFEKIVSDSVLGIRLRLAVVSEAVSLTKEFIQFKDKDYKSIEKFYSNAISMISRNVLQTNFQDECLELLLNFQDYGVKISENMKYEYEFAFSKKVDTEIQKTLASHNTSRSQNSEIPNLNFDTLKKITSWYKDTQKIISNFVAVDYISERASFGYANRLHKILDRILRHIPQDSTSSLHAFKFLITKLPEAFDAVDDSCGSLGMEIEEVVEEFVHFILPYSSELKKKVFRWLFNVVHIGDEYGYFYNMNEILLRTVSGAENVQIFEEIYDDYSKTPKI